MARQRSERAHSQVIEAASALFAERGIEATSMDAIARASGVSKATIYRHWPDKDTLALEVLVYLHGLDKEVPVFDSGDLRRDLVAQLEYDPAADRKAMRERIMPHLIAYASHHRVFGDAWRSRVLSPIRGALSEMMGRRSQARARSGSGIGPAARSTHLSQCADPQTQVGRQSSRGAGSGRGRQLPGGLLGWNEAITDGDLPRRSWVDSLPINAFT